MRAKQFVTPARTWALRLGSSLALALAVSAATPARAAVLTLGPPIDAEFSDTLDGSFQPGGALGLVGLENTDDPRNPQGEDRYALQFNLAALPAGATVTRATLRLRDGSGGAPPRRAQLCLRPRWQRCLLRGERDDGRGAVRDPSG